VTEGLEAAVHRTAPDRAYRRKLDGEQEARLVAVACSEPPSGQKRWTSTPARTIPSARKSAWTRPVANCSPM